MNPSVRATIWDLSSQDHDLLVIGGGATGAGIAREAVLRGLKVALIDRYDFAWGTSSRSSRLIHGGLRYLEHRQWHLVRESLAERAVLLKTAPHLVRRLGFLFPFFRGDRVARWKLEAGLALYDLLALGGNVRRHRALGKRAVLAHEPLIREKGLKGGALYWDGQCDDARLTLAAIRAAASHGAQVANYMCLTAFDLEGGKVRGAIAEDQLTGGQATIRAKVVVNATGSWVDRVRALEDPRAPPILRPTRGAHVMIPRSRIGHHHAITFLSPIDGRVMFVLPWGDRSYIGTTDTDSAESPDRVVASEADILYLIRSANAIFPSARLALEDVSVSWAGLRALIGTGSSAPSSPSAQSREHAILTGPRGVITVAGGKLTTFRRMAVQVVDQARAAIDGRPLVASNPMNARTAAEPLPGGAPFRSEDLFTRGMARGLSEPTVAHLVGQYGSETSAILMAVDDSPDLRQPVHPLHGAIGAQVVHAVRQEYARRLDDVLFRRLSIVHETPDAGFAAAEPVARLMGRELGWDEDRRRQEIERYRDLVHEIPTGRTLSSSAKGKTSDDGGPIQGP
jgi:glycerol-3-phosphate dehydrogenase